MTALPTQMAAVRLPGDSTVEHVTLPVPRPGPGQVLLRMKASSICGSDIRAIYREHLGHGAEAYQGVAAGHEPCGQVVALGEGTRRLAVGDRVVVYHIVGCGMCEDCRRGYHVACHSPFRQAHGWQRDGGHAEYLLTEEATCVLLPEELSYVDGALVSCGFGTAYEPLVRVGVSGRDRVLITGLGPVGLAVAMLAKAMGAGPIIGSDISQARRTAALELGLVHHAVPPEGLDERVAHVTGDGCEVAVDCSGNAQARHAALRNTRAWGRCVFVGEGGSVEFAVSDLLIHKQITLYGSWVTSVLHTEELLANLVRWNLHPECIVTHRYPLAQAAQAYEVAAAGQSGKVCIVFDELPGSVVPIDGSRP